MAASSSAAGAGSGTAFGTSRIPAVANTWSWRVGLASTSMRIVPSASPSVPSQVLASASAPLFCALPPQNVALPLEYLGVTPAETKRRVAELLDRVGLAERARHYPHQL